MFSNRLKPFLIYPFAELDKAKKESVLKGIEVIDFGVGDPETLYVPEIQDYIIDEMRSPDAFRYPSYEGEEKLRRAFCRYFCDRYGVKLDPEKECLVVIGSKEGIAHLPLASLNPNDIAIVPDPGYPVYGFGIAMAGGKIKKILLKEKDGWLLDIGKIDRRAKLIYVNYPSNPTGAVAPLEFFNEIVAEAKKLGAIVVNDAAYSELYFERPTHSILEAKGAKDVAVEFHSASKTFGVPGLRIGFLVGSEKVVVALSALKKNIDSGQFKPIQLALAKAYENPKFIERVRAIFEKRRSLFYEMLNPYLPNLTLPKATFYIWWKIPSSLTFESSAIFAKYLIEKMGVVVLPGIAMGKGGEGYVRFSLTLDEREIIAGCKRLANLCSRAS